MQAEGVEPVVDASSLAVVGLIEVVRHIPRIYGEFQKLLAESARRKPDLAILTDSPDFNLRVAKKLKRMGVPVVYLVAPQAWAWRKDRLPMMQRTIDRLLCIFPFEEDFFRKQGITTTYIGHPLTRLIRTSGSAAEIRARLGVEPDTPLIALLPGSRKGEALRHMPDLVEAAERIRASTAARFVLALPEGFLSRVNFANFKERFSGASIQVQEGQTWDVLAAADLALAASGTVTIEACLSGTPMVTFYRVNSVSWLMGKLLVRVPFFSMVNLIAERRVIPELIQGDLSGERLAREAITLLQDAEARERMRAGLKEVADRLAGVEDPMWVAAGEVEQFLEEEMAHVS